MTGTLLIDGIEHDAESLPALAGMTIERDDPFKCKARKRIVKKLLLHESVSPSDAATERVLRKRGLGVHVVIPPDGRLVQHHDLYAEYPNHASGHNVDSVGVEIISPYYGDRWKASQAWPPPFKAPWAHKKSYIPPTPAQMMTLCALVRAVCNVSLGWLEIATDMPGIDGDNISMGPLGLSKAAIRSTPGIWAHGWTEHADGFFPALVLALAFHRGMSDADAYVEAIRLATGARGTVRFNPKTLV